MSAQADLDRYKRQVGIEGFGASGQEKLSKTAAFVAGVGGLGSAVCIYLAAAGVGHLRIVDHDEVEISNLNRQVLYETEVIGGRKVLLAENRLQRLNPDIRIIEILRLGIAQDTDRQEKEKGDKNEGNRFLSEFWNHDSLP